MELADVNLQEEQEELSNEELQLKMEEVDDAFTDAAARMRGLQQDDDW